MKFKFKIQQYQTEAVENTVAVFTGQPSHSIEDGKYRRDVGMQNASSIFHEDEEAGYCNHEVELSTEQLRENIKQIQIANMIAPLGKSRQSDTARRVPTLTLAFCQR